MNYADLFVLAVVVAVPVIVAAIRSARKSNILP
jgi:hypothetical protein